MEDTRERIYFCLGCTKTNCGAHKINVNKYYNKEKHKLLRVHSSSCIRNNHQYYMVQNEPKDIEYV